MKQRWSSLVLVCLKIEILIYMFHDEIVESLFYLDVMLQHDCLSRYVTACRLTLFRRY